MITVSSEQDIKNKLPTKPLKTTEVVIIDERYRILRENKEVLSKAIEEYLVSNPRAQVMFACADIIVFNDVIIKHRFDQSLIGKLRYS